MLSDLEKFKDEVEKAKAPKRFRSALISCVDLREHLRDKMNNTGLIRKLVSHVLLVPIGFLVHNFAAKVNETSGIFDDKAVIDDLKILSSDLRLTYQSSIVYVGCGEDQTIGRVFPQADHVDSARFFVLAKYLLQKRRNYIRASASQLPHSDCSVDAVIIKALPIDVLDEAETAKELFRVLRPFGYLIIYLNDKTSQLVENLRENDIHFVSGITNKDTSRALFQKGLGK